MSNLRTAAQQALETLEDPWKAGAEGVADAITALRTALAEPERQPLTDEEIEEIRIKEEFDQWGIREGAFKYIARSIERAHGII